MSYEFDLDGETVWDAGFHSGQLYLQLALGASHVLEVPSGLLPDERKGSCDIELPTFRAFAEKLYEQYARTNNIILRGLVEGPLIVSLVLLDRVASPLALRSEDEELLGRRMGEFRRSMG
ncbi:DUF6086 family protein [Streptomyces sp. NPDC020898]|uniref:DUF6086 family protein n=1 Tax=Streptomyces sp. NPDC020898 TaxID=3365101 RepID=UPI0037B28FBD